MVLLRKVLFYLFVLAYLIVCPLTILYAFGIAWKPGQEESVRQRGLLSVSTVPSNAALYFGARRFTQKTPTMVPDLQPGSYPVRLSLKRYRSWTRTVRIEPARATVLKDVLLLPGRWIPRRHLAGAFDVLISSSGGALLLGKGRQLGDFVVYDRRRKSARPFLPRASPLSEARLLSIVRVQGSPALVLRVRTREKERWLWTLPEGERTSVEDLTRLLGKRPRSISWDPQQPENILSFHDSSLDRIDLRLRAVFPRILEGLRGYGVSEGRIYGLTNAHQLIRMEMEADEKVQLPTDLLPARGLLKEEGFVRIVPLREEAFLFLDERGMLVSNRNPDPLVLKGVRNVLPHPTQAHALVWERTRLGVVGVTESSDANASGEETTLRWLVEEARDIRQASWVADGRYILFRDADSLFLLQQWSSDEADGSPLVRVKRHSAFAWSERSGSLYYLQEETGELVSIELIPRGHLPLLPFSEGE